MIVRLKWDNNSVGQNLLPRSYMYNTGFDDFSEEKKSGFIV